MLNKLKSYLREILRSPDERYLAQATDVVDLEMRLRALEARDRAAQFPRVVHNNC